MAKGKYEYWLSDERLILFGGWAREGLTDEQIAEKMNISRSTLYEWKKKYSDISDALKKGKEVVDFAVENALLRRALGFKYKEVIKERIDSLSQKKRHKLGVELTEQQWEISKKYFKNRCCYCGEKTDLTKDHIKPLVKGGKLTMTNVLPACKSCNSSKNDSEMVEWYKKQKFYNSDKLKRINEYIEFAVDICDTFDNAEDNNLFVTKEIIKEALPDTTAQIFWLKNRCPDKWREKTGNAIDDKSDNEIKINILSTRDKKEL